MTEYDMAMNAERMNKVSARVSSNIASFINEFPDVTVFDIIEYSKLMNVTCAKIIAQNALKGDKHPCVREVIQDMNTSSLQLLDALIPDDPSLADDFVWDEPTQAEEVQEPQE